jgi:hypothetical protein
LCVEAFEEAERHGEHHYCQRQASCYRLCLRRGQTFATNQARLRLEGNASTNGVDRIGVAADAAANAFRNI